MFLLDSLLVSGLRFVLDKLQTVAEQELDSVEGLQRALVETQLQLEEGAITEDEFADAEAALLARMRELREQRGEAAGGIAGGASFEGIDVGGGDEVR